MTKDEVLEMLKKLGWEKSMINMMMEFAELIKDIEREECAKRLDAVGHRHCAANIRARGQE
jgi:hypothetical protein